MKKNDPGNPVETPDSTTLVELVVPRAAEQVGHARIVELTGNNVGRMHDVTRQALIGRGLEASVRLHASDISRRHAKIWRTATGQYWISDLDSQNGTLVNGHSIRRRKLNFGDRIQIGSELTLLFTHHDHIEEQLRESRRLESLGQLAGGIAHNFNNLLAAILSNIEFVLDGGPLDPVELRECLTDAQEAGRRAVDLTQQLSSFARLGKYADEPTDLRSVAEEAMGFLRGTLGPHVELSVESAQGVAVEGDRDQLLQIYLNLCLHARDAMPQGGQLTVTTSRENLTRSDVEHRPLLKPGPHAVIEVCDTGPPLTQSELSRVFEPFYSPSDRKGSRLGLATVYGIARNHGGVIEVTSSGVIGETGAREHEEQPTGRLPGGTSFRVFLPAVDQPTDTIDLNEEDIDVAALLGGRMVLLVDDELVVRRSTERLLHHIDCRCISAASGIEALQIVREHRDRIGLVLLDLVMPEMSGEAVYHSMRAIAPDIRVLLVSGWSNEDRTNTLLNRGARGLLRKPFDLARMRRAMAEALR